MELLVIICLILIVPVGLVFVILWPPLRSFDMRNLPTGPTPVDFPPSPSAPAMRKAAPDVWTDEEKELIRKAA